MKLKTFTFLKHKIYLFTTVVIMLGGILSALPAYSQVDYYYGLNTKGVRFGIGGGVSILQSNWTSNPPGGVGLVSLDYDLSPYLSIGVQGQFGMLNGRDIENKLYYYKTAVVYGAGTLNFRVAVGQFTDFKTRSALQDIVKKFYVGVGAGMAFSNTQITPHSNVDNLGLASESSPQDSVQAPHKPSGTYFKGNGAYPCFPVNVGTNISLRGFLGSDKIDLNPNFQYTFVMSPLFDGYMPSARDVPASYITKNGNQSYMVISLTLRYKF